jgi:hypothetical protein
MAQLSQNPPEGIVPQIRWCIQWIFQLRGRTTSGGGGGTPTLTSTYIGYGDSSNLLTGSPDIVYDPVVGSFLLNPLGGNSIFSVSSAGSIKLNAGVNNTQIYIDDIKQLITITNVPTYANDAAAIAANLITGNLYKSTTAGVTNLHIVP